MKASVRKQVQQLLTKLPAGQKKNRLQREFQEKGFLSKRELKELYGCKEVKSLQIAPNKTSGVGSGEGPTSPGPSRPKTVEFLPNERMMKKAFGDFADEEANEFGYKGPGWYFWDETWSQAHGPFPSENDAHFACNEYAKTL